MWSLTKGRRKAVCELWTDPSGWKLRLRSGATLRPSQACGTLNDVLDTAEAWKATMITQRWR